MICQKIKCTHFSVSLVQGFSPKWQGTQSPHQQTNAQNLCLPFILAFTNYLTDFYFFYSLLCLTTVPQFGSYQFVCISKSTVKGRQLAWTSGLGLRFSTIRLFISCSVSASVCYCRDHFVICANVISVRSRAR